MSTGDANYIKHLNRRILVEHIVKEGALSRSDLSRKTGLNKATVSAQVSSMIEDGIVTETKVGDITTPGRKPILVEMNGESGFSIGVDIDDQEVRVVFIDIKGKPIHREVIPNGDKDINTLVSEVKENLSPLIQRFEASHSPIGLTGICLGIHGIINNEDEIEFTPKQQWTHVNLKERLEKEIDVPIYIDNNANLSAYGEQVYFENIPDLFCITLYSGIGLGIINDYTIYRGFRGFAGEIGHMIIEPHGPECQCGNHGCWELYASERTLKKQLSSLGQGSDFIDLLAKPEAEPILSDYIDYLSYGLNNVINIFNPQRIVLNGALINQNPEFVDRVQRALHSKINSYESIRISQLGEYACALGGAAYVLKNYLDVNTLDFVQYDYFEDTKLFA
ncbi:ROK family transcriptional regulator [Salimicrobium halophilum]|uniref:ROK family transcriptional regulator n=1 Tax=Salimicrobium halophilum TaxID=86666 RepID=UPI001160010D|nr:ROK family transcriptional regulator [Salimicrobium halophilum]